MQWSKAGQGCWIFPDVSKTRGASVPRPDDTRALWQNRKESQSRLLILGMASHGCTHSRLWMLKWLSPSSQLLNRNQSPGPPALRVAFLSLVLAVKVSDLCRLRTTVCPCELIWGLPCLMSCVWILHVMKPLSLLLGFPGGSDGKESACSAVYTGDAGSIPGSGRSPEEGNCYLLQYSCLENSMDWRAWWATVHGVTKSWTWLSN